MLKAWGLWCEYVRHVGVWFKRFGDRRCWRIHSPSAYQFARQVLFASATAMPADKAAIAKAHHTARHTYADHTWQRYHRLVYRLANYQLAHTTPNTPLHWVIITAEGQSSLLPYLEGLAEQHPERSIRIVSRTAEGYGGLEEGQGSSQSQPDFQFQPQSQSQSQPQPQPQSQPEPADLLYIDHPCADTYEPILWHAIATAHPHTLLVLRHPYRTSATTALWQRIEHHPHTTVTFDGYYWGLVRFGKGLSKEAHRVCF